MKTAHKILILLALPLAYFAVRVWADSPARKLLSYPLGVYNGWSTANVSAGTNLFHFLVQSSQFLVYLGTSNSAANSSNTILTLYPTPDGVRTNTTQVLQVSLTNSGTLYSSVVSNFTAGGLGEYFLIVSNANNTAGLSNFVDLIFNQKSGL
jgi:hypothetical protein